MDVKLISNLQYFTQNDTEFVCPFRLRRKKKMDENLANKKEQK